MKRYGLSLVLLLAGTSMASAWNDKGHMTVARLAWKELTAAERAKIVAFLKSHPHSDEFLKAAKPDNFPEDEWVFLRAATWADWIKSKHPNMSVGERHYINYPFVTPGSTVVPPKLDETGENIVTGITKQLAEAKGGGNQESRAKAITWLFHLVGDIHQPLHTTALFNDDFPKGDRGGNWSTVQISGGHNVQLHSYWDGLLGKSTSRSSILGTVLEATNLGDDDPTAAKNLKANTTPESWAKESFELAKKVAYQNGTLKPANNHDHLEDATIPMTQADYAEKAGETARLGAYKGGKRLAQLLREVIAAND